MRILVQPLPQHGLSPGLVAAWFDTGVAIAATSLDAKRHLGNSDKIARRESSLERTDEDRKQGSFARRLANNVMNTGHKLNRGWQKTEAEKFDFTG